MNEYQREQLDAFRTAIDFLETLDQSRRRLLEKQIEDYLQFRERVAYFLRRHFEAVCTTRCYQNQESACCSKDGILVFFADVVINAAVSSKAEVERLAALLKRPNSGGKCIYLTPRGCSWRLKPKVCEMFLCDRAKRLVFEADPAVKNKWKEIREEEKGYTWPDRPVLFETLERMAMAHGLHSSLMHMHQSPGLRRVRKLAGRQ